MSPKARLEETLQLLLESLGMLVLGTLPLGTQPPYCGKTRRRGGRLVSRPSRTSVAAYHGSEEPSWASGLIEASSGFSPSHHLTTVP